MSKEGGEGFGGGGREVGFGEGVSHEGEPAVAGAFIDHVGGVAHAEAGMSALLDIAHGSAEAADEEFAETLLGPGEIVRGIHGAEDVVGGDLTVEGGDEAMEAVLADRGIDFVFRQTGH